MSGVNYKLWLDGPGGTGNSLVIEGRGGSPKYRTFCYGCSHRELSGVRPFVFETSPRRGRADRRRSHFYGLFLFHP